MTPTERLARLTTEFDQVDASVREIWRGLSEKQQRNLRLKVRELQHKGATTEELTTNKHAAMFLIWALATLRQVEVNQSIRGCEDDA